MRRCAVVRRAAPSHSLGWASTTTHAATATARSTFCVVQATDGVALAPIVVGRYYDRFACDEDGWYYTERIADVEMLGDVSEHLLIDHRRFDAAREQD